MKKILEMSTQSENKGNVLFDWGLFLVSTVAMIVMLAMGSPYAPWFWLFLPFSLTSFVRALNAM